MAHTLDLRTGALHVGRRQTGIAEARGFHLGKLDLTRIGAEAGAIAINAVALLLLLAPLTPPFTPAEQYAGPDVVILVPPKKPPEKFVEITKQPRIHPITPPTVTPPKIEAQEPPPLADNPLPEDTFVEHPQIADAGFGRSSAITEPLPGAHLEYQVTPAPPYPIDAIRSGLTGTVTLRVLVDIDGKPIDVQIEHSSGHRVLDAAACKQVLAKWRFKPAMQDGQLVQAIGLIPVVFSLNQ